MCTLCTHRALSSISSKCDMWERDSKSYYKQVCCYSDFFPFTGTSTVLVPGGLWVFENGRWAIRRHQLCWPLTGKSLYPLLSRLVVCLARRAWRGLSASIRQFHPRNNLCGVESLHQLSWPNGLDILLHLHVSTHYSALPFHVKCFLPETSARSPANFTLFLFHFLISQTSLKS